MIKYISFTIITVAINILITSLFLVKESPKLVAVDTNRLFMEYVMAISNSIDSDEEDEIQNKVKIHEEAIKIFNKEIVQIASDNNIVILDKRMVIGGAEDQTILARNLLKNLMQEVNLD